MNVFKLLEYRFWDKVDKNGPIPVHCPELGNCWVWKRAKNEHGYGDFRTFGDHDKAHRVAWQIKHGGITKKVFVLHKCDNPACVNPSHLFTGTQKDNIQDMIRKGRHGYTPHYGENNGYSKLTWEKVREIRLLFLKGGFTHIALAHKFGVSRPCICQVVNHKHWIER
jgi:hypothetical protein